MKHIVEGYKNLILSIGRSPSQSVEIRAKKRLDICHECDERVTIICTKCGCPLAAKVRSNKVCDLDKWPK